ncbi:uncharacterized protein LOC113465217 [Ceratina calcarata]|uniref:Uncharacterized protein LOC113465217 n=1 Tax=Ceratina calcarata TaxID=156304 RepID=A0AAJ7SDX5_9HYME|nr:uncharacterized protein LOC113465217 [Ceratina calcarata]
MHETPYYDKFPAANWTDVLYDLKKDISPNVLNVNDPNETWVWTERGLCFATRSMTAKFYSMENWRKQNMPWQDDPYSFPQYSPDNKILEKFRVEHTSMISIVEPLEYLIFDNPTKLIESKMLHSAIVQTYNVGMQEVHKRLSVRQRGCKMIVDGGLPAVPFYSENVCYAECRMREILKKCYCRPHFAKPIGK